MKYWAVIPAAGLGARMGAQLPKQYLPLRGRAILEHTVERFSRHPRISSVMVAISAEDRHWEQLSCASLSKVRRITGGAERCHSVLNALKALAGDASAGDWVLVHDAARPCLRASDIDKMIDVLSGHPIGGILAVPVRDTMKRADAGGGIMATVDRNGLWHALTPQMFHLGVLADAIEQAIVRGQLVTDEAQAMELIGHVPLLVEGHPDNIKVTQPQDLTLAELYLRHQEETQCA
ncbi:MAG: 2-C-methyl-D-erythritol 4-phosphate cytidylyltransferase [Chromatiales bacterium]